MTTILVRDTQKKQTRRSWPRDDGAETEGCGHEPRMPGAPQKLEEVQSRHSPPPPACPGQPPRTLWFRLRCGVPSWRTLALGNGVPCPRGRLSPCLEAGAGQGAPGLAGLGSLALWPWACPCCPRALGSPCFLLYNPGPSQGWTEWAGGAAPQPGSGTRLAVASVSLWEVIRHLPHGVWWGACA